MCCFEKVIFGRLEVKSTNHINDCNKLTSILLSVIILKVRFLSPDVTSLDYTYLTGPFSYELFDALRQKLFASLDAITGLVQRRVNTLSSKCPSNLSRFATFTRNFHLLNEFLLILPKLRRNSYYYYFPSILRIIRPLFKIDCWPGVQTRRQCDMTQCQIATLILWIHIVSTLLASTKIRRKNRCQIWVDRPLENILEVIFTLRQLAIDDIIFYYLLPRVS